MRAPAAPSFAASSLVNLGHEGLRKDPARHTGLIRDDDHRITGPIQSCDCVCGERKNAQTADVIQVAHLFANRAVAIEKDRRAAATRNLRHDVTPALRFDCSIHFCAAAKTCATSIRVMQR